MADFPHSSSVAPMYNPRGCNPLSGVNILTKRAIPLTQNTKLVIVICQEEEFTYPPVTPTETWDVIPCSKITYAVYLWEVLGNEYHTYRGFKHLCFQSHVTTYSRYLVAQLTLKDMFKEPQPIYSHYEIELDIVIFEPFGQITNSTMRFS